VKLAARAASALWHAADGQEVRWPVGRATVTDGRTPHSPASFFQGAGGDGSSCGCAVGLRRRSLPIIGWSIRSPLSSRRLHSPPLGVSI